MARGRPEVPKHLAKQHAQQMLEQRKRADVYEKGLQDAAKLFAAGSFFPADVAEGVTQKAFIPPASYKFARMRPPVPSDYQIDEKTGKPVFKGKPPVANPEYKGTTEHVGKLLGVDVTGPGAIAPQALSLDPLAKIKALGILGKAGLEGLGGLGALYGGLKKVGKAEKAEDVARPIFTSPGKLAAADISKETIPANKVKNQLEGRGVSKDEMEWTGFNDWIKTKKGEVSKAEIEEFFEQNQIQVQEVVKGGKASWPEEKIEEIATNEVLYDFGKYREKIVDKIVEKQQKSGTGSINDPAVLEAWNDSSLSSQGFLKWDDLSKDQQEGFARQYRLDNNLPGIPESAWDYAGDEYDLLLRSWGDGTITEAEMNKLMGLHKDGGAPDIDQMYQNTLAEIEAGEYSLDHLGIEGAATQVRYPQKDLQLPGGENYRELLLRVPAKKVPWTKENVVPISGEEYVRGAGYGEQTPQYKEFTDPVRGKLYWFFKTPDGAERVVVRKREGTKISQEEALEKILANPTEPKPRFTSGHWDESDVIAHIRFNERVDPDGNKVLFIEEIQSDWAHKGKDVGFAGPENTAARTELENIVMKRRLIKDKIVSKQAKIVELDSFTEAEKKIELVEEKAALQDELSLIQKEYDDVLDKHKVTGKEIQPGPFVTDAHQWTNLALKRMIRWGSDEGFDSIAWVTGKQSADRYNVRDLVDQIIWNPKSEMLTGLKNNEQVLAKNVPKDELTNVVGKDIANKLLKGTPEDKAKVIQDWEDGLITHKERDWLIGSVTVHGDDLEIGGQYHKFIYDKVLTEQAKKIGKKHGAKVEEGGVMAPDPTMRSLFDAYTEDFVNRYEVQNITDYPKVFEDEIATISNNPEVANWNNFVLVDENGEYVRHSSGGITFFPDQLSADRRLKDMAFEEAEKLSSKELMEIFPDVDEAAEKVWTMRLTDKLKEASREGLPYYMVLPPLVIGGAAAQRTDAQRQQAKTDAQAILAQ